ncbi:MAG: hypothetical protein ABI254_14285, partial [Chthoniobacterales bacterium]
SIELYGENTTVPEAVSLTKKICQAWGVSTEGLDDTAAHLGTMPGDSLGWGHEFNLPGISAQVIFKPLYYFTHLGGYVNIVIQCGKYPNGVKFLKGPIQPPAGYENVSMEPPPFKPTPVTTKELLWLSALILVVTLPVITLIGAILVGAYILISDRLKKVRE